MAGATGSSPASLTSIAASAARRLTNAEEQTKSGMGQYRQRFARADPLPRLECEVRSPLPEFRDDSQPEPAGAPARFRVSDRPGAALRGQTDLCSAPGIPRSPILRCNGLAQPVPASSCRAVAKPLDRSRAAARSEEHTSEL